MPTKEQLLERPVKLSDLVEKLALDEDSFEEEVREQPKLFLEASRYRAMKMRKRATASFMYDRAMAEVKLEGRKLKDDKGKKKLTEGALSDRALLSDNAHKYRTDMDEAYLDEELAKGLVEAWRQRGQMLKIISDIRCSEVGSEIRSVRENLIRDDMKRNSQSLRERVDRKYGRVKGHPDKCKCSECFR